MIAVIGCGNILRGDDGLGVWVIRELEKKAVSQDVFLIDGGTRGIDLLSYLEGVRKAIIVDAVISGNQPGNIYRIPWEDTVPFNISGSSTHNFTWEHTLRLGKEILKEKFPKEIVIFGMEVRNLETRVSLSPLIQNRLQVMVDCIQKEISGELLQIK